MTTPASSHKRTVLAAALTGADWSKSSYSGGEGNCVEVADLRHTAYTSVAVRDSKDPKGPALLFAPDQFTAFATFAAGFEV